MELNADDMLVVKRNGDRVGMSSNKIFNRLKKIGDTSGITDFDYSTLVTKVVNQLYDNIETKKIDELLAEECANSVTDSLDFGVLASNIEISNHHKMTSPSFTETVKQLYNNAVPIVTRQIYDFGLKYENEINKSMDHSRDFLIDYFGFKTLDRSYLFKINDKPVERIQHMWFRVAICIHGDDFPLVKETYDLMSNKYFTHATPTLFNACTPNQQLSSCYLLAMEDDSIEGIYNTLKDCALISKYSGGIGLHIHNVRGKNSIIRGTNGKTDGLVPMLRVFNSTARYVNQSGKRNGSFAIYLEPWHPDIEEFLDLRKNQGDEEKKARDLFYALWIPDLFMERVKENGKWSYFCPDECAGLSDKYGDEFKQLYEYYEMHKTPKKVVDARELWTKILTSQMETGTPYMLYKDSANKKSNQQNLGTIKSSNLCCEIIQYSSNDETAVCNLASLGLPTFVDRKTKTFDYEKLHKVTKVVTNNLNKVIDVNFYPTEKTKNSNLRHRPIGIGVQGLADAFILMGVPFFSEEAKCINKLIFETIYHASLEMSNEIALNRSVEIDKLLHDGNISRSKKILISTGVMIREEVDTFISTTHMIKKETWSGAYSSFRGSPCSQGILQFDMWGVTPSSRYNWNELKEKIKTYGIRNSLLVAPMPTASTSQIFGFNECFEPITSNIYTRRTLAGEFVVVNKYLMKELSDLGIWNSKIKNDIIANKGSVQQLTILPQEIRDKYKIVWEMPMKHLIEMSADRGAFVCQSQSLNLWLEDPTINSLTSMHFFAWQKGLKTGIYYLRRKAKHRPQQFTIEPTRPNASYADDGDVETCEMCSA